MLRMMLLIGSLAFATHALALVDNIRPLTQEDIYRVQSKLYNLNFDVEVDGKLGPKTRKAIEGWQRLYQHKKPTGVLTEFQFQGLMSIDTSKLVWGAMSFSLNGSIHTYRSTWGHKSRYEAEVKVLSPCLKEATRIDECHVATIASTTEKAIRDSWSWLVAVRCDDHRGTGIAWSPVDASSEEEARDKAYPRMKSLERYSVTQCKTLGIIEAGGRHVR